MGGHGALTLALRHPELFRSVSAFAPIAAPMRCPWGQKAFGGYLGADQAAWRAHDATELMKDAGRAPFPDGILIDQGLADKFLAEQLYPEAFEEACRAAGQPLELRRHAGYDHGYYFISTFVEDHLRFAISKTTCASTGPGRTLGRRNAAPRRQRDRFEVQAELPGVTSRRSTASAFAEGNVSRQTNSAEGEQVVYSERSTRRAAQLHAAVRSTTPSVENGILMLSSNRTIQ
jgi:acetyl esterase/lipase